MSGSDTLPKGNAVVTIAHIEPPISHSDVTTIMNLLAHIQDDVRRIRRAVEEDGEEEEEDSGRDG
jgi:hypothetical protein